VLEKSLPHVNSHREKLDEQGKNGKTKMKKVLWFEELDVSP
jgi:hypothetical protein